MCSWIFFLFSVHLVVVRSRLHYRRTNPVCEFCAHNCRIFQPHTHDNNHNNNNNVKRTEAYAGFEKHRKMKESRSYIRISGRWWSYLARMHTHAWYSVCRVRCLWRWAMGTNGEWRICCCEKGIANERELKWRLLRRRRQKEYNIAGLSVYLWRWSNRSNNIIHAYEFVQCQCNASNNARNGLLQYDAMLANEEE